MTPDPRGRRPTWRRRGRWLTATPRGPELNRETIGLKRAAGPSMSNSSLNNSLCLVVQFWLAVYLVFCSFGLAGARGAGGSQDWESVFDNPMLALACGIRGLRRAGLGGVNAEASAVESSPSARRSADASRRGPTCLACGAAGGAAAVFHRAVVPHVLRVSGGSGRPGPAPHRGRHAAGRRAGPGVAA